MSDAPAPNIRISTQSRGDYSGMLIEFSKEAFRHASMNWPGEKHVRENQLSLSGNPADQVRSMVSVIEAIQEWGGKGQATERAAGIKPAAVPHSSARKSVAPCRFMS